MFPSARRPNCLDHQVVTNLWRAPGLTTFQLEVAQLFFSLAASRGFLLAGGAALLAQHLSILHMLYAYRAISITFRRWNACSTALRS